MSATDSRSILIETLKEMQESSDLLDVLADNFMLASDSSRWLVEAAPALAPGRSPVWSPQFFPDTTLKSDWLRGGLSIAEFGHFLTAN